MPTLRQGDVIVLDNLGSHTGEAVRRAVREAGAHLLFLPPYSLDLNPIEMTFAKLKTLLRKADDDPSPPSGSASDHCSINSAPQSAETISATPHTGQGVTRSYATRLVRLICLAPDIKAAILDGQQPAAFSANNLMVDSRLPLAWSAQRQVLGFSWPAFALDKAVSSPP